MKLKKFIKNNKSQLRYIISGSFFTLTGPSFFIFLASFIKPSIAILISEIFIHSIRYYVITRWVFLSKLNKSSAKAYIKATLPLFLFNFIVVLLVVPLLGTIPVAIFLGIFSATIGFAWNRICYFKLPRINKKI